MSTQSPLCIAHQNAHLVDVPSLFSSLVLLQSYNEEKNATFYFGPPDIMHMQYKHSLWLMYDGMSVCLKD
jgi:hypothetical protein